MSTEETTEIKTSVEVSNESIDKLVNRYMMWSLGVGYVPLPVLDYVALTSMQAKMVYELSKLYEVDFAEERVKTLIGSLLGAALPYGAATPVASLIKLIPGFGTVAGGAAMGLMGAASTYALASVFVQHFESGGTMLNFNAAKMRDTFKEKFQQGKSVASELKASKA